ncbi:MAG: hypothetical protein QNK33_09860 [Bacteroidales bacterium]|nr:hypothetical protein [Bacteroidales bacterium]
MKRIRNILLLTVVIMTSINAYAQKGFAEGYIVDNMGIKKNCMINRYLLKENPFCVEYTQDEGETLLIATTDDIKEFGLINSIKYIRSSISGDWFFDNVDTINARIADPNGNVYFFLRSVVEGKASLFELDIDGKIWYFYGIDNSGLTQLVTHRNPITLKDKHKRELYRKQLSFMLNVNGIVEHDILYLKYEAGDLADLMITYNKSFSEPYINFNNIKNRNLFAVRIKPGIAYSSFAMKENGLRNLDTLVFSSNTNYRFALEAEMILPWYNRRLSLLLEPSVQSYNFSAASSIMFDLGDMGDEKTISLSYTSIDLGFGIRANLFNTKYSKLSVTGKLVASINLKSEYLKDDDVLFILPGGSFYPAAELMYEYKRYSFFATYNLMHNITPQNSSWKSDLSTISFSLGIDLLQLNKN